MYIYFQVSNYAEVEQADHKLRFNKAHHQITSSYVVNILADTRT
jgi:hypothetical protein